MIVAPVFTVEGDAQVYTWRHAGRRLVFENPRETNGDFKAEIAAEMLAEDGLTWGTLGCASHNLMNTRSREEGARAANSLDDAFDWHAAFTTACILAVREYRRGAPIIDLSTVTAAKDLRYLVWPFLPLDETTVIFADGGSGKSAFASVLELSVLTGWHCPGTRRPLRTGPVLLLDFETHGEEQKRRRDKLIAGIGLDAFPQGFHYRQCFRPIAEDAAFLRRERERLGAELVVVDSIAPACADDVSKPGVAVAAMNAIRSIGGTRLVLAHVTKAAAVEAGTPIPATIFGSAFFRNMARNVWEMRSAAADSEEEAVNPIALFHRKSNNDRLIKRPMGYRFKFDENTTTIELHDIDIDSPLAGTLPVSSRIRTALAHGAATVKDLAESIGSTDAATRMALKRMRDVLQLQGDSRGGRGKAGMWALKGDGPDGSCSRCGARVFRYTDAGVPLCEVHGEMVS